MSDDARYLAELAVALDLDTTSEDFLKLPRVTIAEGARELRENAVSAFCTLTEIGDALGLPDHARTDDALVEALQARLDRLDWSEAERAKLVELVAEEKSPREILVPASLHFAEIRKLRTALLMVPAFIRRELATELPELADCYDATKLLAELDLVAESRPKKRKRLDVSRLNGPAFEPPEPRLVEPDFDETVEEEAARLTDCDS